MLIVKAPGTWTFLGALFLLVLLIVTVLVAVTMWHRSGEEPVVKEVVQQQVIEQKSDLQAAEGNAKPWSRPWSGKIPKELVTEGHDVMGVYGGHFWDGGVLKIYAASGWDDPVVHKELEEVVLKRLGRREGVNVVILEAQYSWQDLGRWYRKLRDPVWGSHDEVISSDLDEALNRIEYGLTDMSVVEDVKATVREQGLPVDAVVFYKSGPSTRD